MRFIRTRFLQLIVDGLIIAMSFAVAYGIRFEGFPPRHYAKQFFLVLPYLILLRVGILAAFGVYRLVWRYISFRDLPRVVLATGCGSLVVLAARFAAAPMLGALGFKINPLYATVPLGVLAAELVLTTAGIVGARSLWRFLNEERGRRAVRAQVQSDGRHRALLIGAGSAGVMVAREAATNPSVGFTVVGFLDDDRDKHGSVIHGHKVLGGSAGLEHVARETGADLAIITMACASAAAIRRIVDLAEGIGLRVQIIPGLYEILSGQVNISKIRDVAIEDLLGRDPVHLEEDQIAAFIAGKRVLVTGAGGSIGSEMCRQICRYKPAALLLLDQAENPLYHIHRELMPRCPEVPLRQLIGSVANRTRMGQLMAEHRPEVVFHAAAHKHVPLMELNPAAAVRNNTVGTSIMADLAHEHAAEAFVMISTDKAVNPTSVMGATKRMAEMYVQALAARSKTRFTTVRFGNVLGSEGSVVPLFKEQIARGGPVTVTHPEMKRYFMTIPEASQLVLQAATMGRGGEIFILEMGKPIRIVDLARDLIRLSGYAPDDEIKIAFTGMRAGEKLYEEINLSEENAAKTRHPRIWIGHCQVSDVERVRTEVGDLQRLADATQVTPEQVRSALHQYVPEYLEGGTASNGRRSPGQQEGDAVAGRGGEEAPKGQLAEGNAAAG